MEEFWLVVGYIVFCGLLAFFYWRGVRDGKEQAKEEYNRKLRARAIECRQTTGERWARR